MTFQPATAYGGDWAYHSFVEDARIYPASENTDGRISYLIAKVKRDNLSEPHLAAVASAITATQDAAGFVVWPNDPQAIAGTTLKLQPGDVIRLGALGDGEQWTIKGVEQSRFGHWLASAVKRRTDG